VPKTPVTIETTVLTVHRQRHNT